MGRAPKRNKVATRRGRLPAWARLSWEPRWLTYSALGLISAAILERLASVFWLGAVASKSSFQLCSIALALGSLAAVRRAWPALTACALLAALWGIPWLAWPARPAPLRRRARATLDGCPPRRSCIGSGRARHRPRVSQDRRCRAERGVPSVLAPLLEHDALRHYRVVASPPTVPTWVLFIRRDLLEAATPTRRGRGSKASTRLHVGRCDLFIQPLNLPSVLDYGARTMRTQTLRSMVKLPATARSVWFGQLGSSTTASDVQEMLPRPRTPRRTCRLRSHAELARGARPAGAPSRAAPASRLAASHGAIDGPAPDGTSAAHPCAHARTHRTHVSRATVTRHSLERPCPGSTRP